jgi:hypothetical protein
MEKKISLEELTLENVLELSEEDVSDLLIEEATSDMPKEKKSYYVGIISNVFDFRSISAKNRGLKGDLSYFGFKFFTIPDNKMYIRGIRRKTAKI